MELLEERYKQLERNFYAVVAELRDKGLPNSQLQAITTRLEADLKRSLVRSEAAGAGSVQRLEEREAILHRNFTAVVELLGPTGRSPSAPAPAAGGDAEGSPFSRHPWAASGGAVDHDGSYAAPPKVSPRLPSGEGSSPANGEACSVTRPKRYDSFPSSDNQPPSSPSNVVGEGEAAARRRLEEVEAALAEARRAGEETASQLASVREEAARGEERRRAAEEAQQALQAELAAMRSRALAAEEALAASSHAADEAASSHALAVSSLEARLASLEGAVEEARAEERLASRQAQMHATRADELAREVALLLERLDSRRAEAACGGGGGGGGERQALRRMVGAACRQAVCAQLAAAELHVQLGVASKRSAARGGGERAAEKGGGEKASEAITLREDCDSLRDQCEALETDLVQKDEDTQHLRRLLHAAREQFQQERHRVAQTRALLGGAVRAKLGLHDQLAATTALLRTALDRKPAPAVAGGGASARTLSPVSTAAEAEAEAEGGWAESAGSARAAAAAAVVGQEDFDDDSDEEDDEMMYSQNYTPAAWVSARMPVAKVEKVHTEEEEEEEEEEGSAGDEGGGNGGGAAKTADDSDPKLQVDDKAQAEPALHDAKAGQQDSNRVVFGTRSTTL
ncbi:hypothetical protein AB1Y20_010412 [Prymnesium parvum]|uniref:Uncharacterized protein n=1 Tax=Prymnesium parvum TaxID=97485 RepID=A0AB34IP73_PRYPA